MQVFVTSLDNIKKVIVKLTLKASIDIMKMLPEHYHDYLDVFSLKKTNKLSPLREKSVNHSIELIKDMNDCTPDLLWRLLYSMSWNKLLILCCMLTDYLDKSFICVSMSSATTPVLFAKKSGSGLRFCIDYQDLNHLTQKDQYPLPLINETLQKIGKACWFTKLNIIHAFHKICITKRDEWITIF